MTTFAYLKGKVNMHVSQDFGDRVFFLKGIQDLSPCIAGKKIVIMKCVEMIVLACHSASCFECVYMY
jgi:hypothetical protein